MFNYNDARCSKHISFVLKIRTSGKNLTMEMFFFKAEHLFQYNIAQPLPLLTL